MAPVIARADLVGWLKLSDQVGVADGPVLDTVTGAVSEYVNGPVPARAAQLKAAGDPADPSTVDWSESIRLGALMLAARLYRRRNSPTGIEGFADAGVSYVARQDPDVARLLGLAQPMVG